MNKRNDKYEKMKEIKSLALIRDERKVATKYLQALRNDDTTFVQYFESFGDNIRAMIMNYIAYQQGLIFGFTDKEFDEFGWLKSPKFLEVEEFDFPHKSSTHLTNSVIIGKGKNDKWTYGRYIYNECSGHSSGLSVWNGVCNSREEALKEVLELMKKAHETTYKARYSSAILKQVKELYDIVTKRNVVQLSLFD